MTGPRWNLCRTGSCPDTSLSSPPLLSSSAEAASVHKKWLTQPCSSSSSGSEEPSPDLDLELGTGTGGCVTRLQLTNTQRSASTTLR